MSENEYGLTTYIYWTTLKTPNEITIYNCGNQQPIVNQKYSYQQKSDLYLTTTFIDKLFQEFNITIPIQLDLNPFFLSLATRLLNALNKSQLKSVNGILAENLSCAQCYYYLTYVADKNLTLNKRDKLYGYLLIDNQDSYQVISSQIAAAIASVQL